jgi:hypothetical protein
MNNYLKILAAGALAVAAVLPASAAQVRVGVNFGAPAVYAQPAPAYYYGAPRVVRARYYDNRYDLRARRDAEWRHREWLRREQWRREQYRREHWRHERHWDGHR